MIRSCLAGYASRALLALALIPGASFATDYYLSPSGNDSNAGTSSAAPWKTLAKINGRNFVAGDRILLQGGQTFSGGLVFGAADAGTPVNPVIVSSYGSGRAIVSSGLADGLYAYNAAGFAISRLVFIGSGASTNTKGGITFYTDLANNVKLKYVDIDDVDVSGYRQGIVIGGGKGASGYTDVSVTNTDAHDNQRTGMIVYAQSRYGHTNVYVGDSRFYNNLGDPALTTNSGSGVVLGEVDGGIIERSLAWGNGAACTAREGPVGIWAYDSNNITIQYNESFDNRTNGTADGGGFDLDGGVTNSVVQYNYSHGNDGAGIGLYQYSGASAWSNNVVRYNISENDGRKNGYGAITVWNGASAIGGADIYGNTIFVSPSPANTSRGVRFLTNSKNFRFFNNIIVTTGGLRLLDAPSGQTALLFQGNDWWASGGTFAIGWNGTTYSSLAAWATATGQEKSGATLVGKNVDPRLNNPGAGGTIGDPDLLATLDEYKLQAGSPMIDAGINLAALGITPGARDFYGSPIPQGAFDIGAHEVAFTGPANQPPAVTDVIANPNPVSATTSALNAIASDDGGEPSLVYTWSKVGAPAGGAAMFSPNGTNAAKASTATFTRAGSYILRVTARDAQAAIGTYDFAVTVNAVATSLTVTPATASVQRNASLQFAAAVRDQFGVALAAQPVIAWSIAGPNTISATGLAKAGPTDGTYTVTATGGGMNGTAALTVTKKKH